MRYILSLVLALIGNSAVAQSNYIPYTKPNAAEVMDMQQDAQRLFQAPPRTLTHETNLGCIAVTVFHEARGESIPGQRAVADVVIQRALVPNRWGSTPCDVVQPVQFSYLDENRNFARINMNDPIDRQSWERAVRVALTSLVMGPDPQLKGADHYHTHQVTPSWRLAMDVVQVIGNHIFYLDPDSVEKTEEFMLAAGGRPQITGIPVSHNPAVEETGTQVVDLYDWSGEGVPQKTQIIQTVDLYQTQPQRQYENTAFQPVRAWDEAPRNPQPQTVAAVQEPATEAMGSSQPDIRVASRDTGVTRNQMGLQQNAVFGFRAPSGNDMPLGINPQRNVSRAQIGQPQVQMDEQ